MNTSKIECKKCEGHGKTHRGGWDEFDNPINVKTCVECDGEGEVEMSAEEEVERLTGLPVTHIFSMRGCDDDECNGCKVFGGTNDGDRGWCDENVELIEDERAICLCKQLYEEGVIL